MCDVFFATAKKRDVMPLLRRHHYIGSQCADPSFVFAWLRPGGLFGDRGLPCAAALFAPPASFRWGADAIELSRLVADATDKPPLTQFLSSCVSAIRKTRRYAIVIAYADPSANHHGGIYQAASWLHVGTSSRKVVYVHKQSGKRSSQRSFDQSNYAAEHWRKLPSPGKYTYILPLTRKARRAWAAKAKPYPRPSNTPRQWRDCGCTEATEPVSEASTAKRSDTTHGPKNGMTG